MIQYSKKIPDKNDIYYIEHREGTNRFRLRKDPQKAEKDKLITMLETADRAVQRSTIISKLSQLKRIKKQFVKNTKIWENNLLNLNDELKKTI